MIIVIHSKSTLIMHIECTIRPELCTKFKNIYHMKRRICKKLHIKDYVELGTLVKFTAPHDNEDKLLYRFQVIVEKHNLFAWGGGCRTLITPKMDNDYIVPNVIEQFILGMMNVEDSDTMAFIIHKPGGNADQSAFVKEIKEVFNEVKYKLEVFENIDLWRKAY